MYAGGVTVTTIRSGADAATFPAFDTFAIVARRACEAGRPMPVESAATAHADRAKECDLAQERHNLGDFNRTRRLGRVVQHTRAHPRSCAIGMPEQLFRGDYDISAAGNDGLYAPCSRRVRPRRAASPQNDAARNKPGCQPEFQTSHGGSRRHEDQRHCRGTHGVLDPGAAHNLLQHEANHCHSVARPCCFRSVVTRHRPLDFAQGGPFDFAQGGLLLFCRGISFPPCSDFNGQQDEHEGPAPACIRRLSEMLDVLTDGARRPRESSELGAGHSSDFIFGSRRHALSRNQHTAHGGRSHECCRRRRHVDQECRISSGGSQASGLCDHGTASARRFRQRAARLRPPSAGYGQPRHSIDVIGRLCQLAIVLQTQNGLEHPSGIRTAYGSGKYRARKRDHNGLTR